MGFLVKYQKHRNKVYTVHGVQKMLLTGRSFNVCKVNNVQVIQFYGLHAISMEILITSQISHVGTQVKGMNNIKKDTVKH